MTFTMQIGATSPRGTVGHDNSPSCHTCHVVGPSLPRQSANLLAWLPGALGQPHGHMVCKGMVGPSCQSFSTSSFYSMAVAGRMENWRKSFMMNEKNERKVT